MLSDQVQGRPPASRHLIGGRRPGVETRIAGRDDHSAGRGDHEKVFKQVNRGADAWIPRHS